MESRRRASRWKIVLGLVAAVSIVSGGSALWIRAVAERRWESMRVEVLRLLHEEQARPPARPVLRGTAVP